ncbi:MAG: RNA methyltransferase [Bacteroidales bacterium]|nr:RNA methyltransferase [Bacteroidales bacterium]
MLSQSQIKQITALQVRKYREELGLFMAEGEKLVLDLIRSEFKVAAIYASSSWIIDHLAIIREKEIPAIETLPREMERISALSTPSPVLAVVKKPESGSLISISAFCQPSSGLSLALDNIRDPGNFGTIIRIADWFGIKRIWCSENTVDLYNPKVVQATMGSIARVEVMYEELDQVFARLNGQFPVFGAYLEGENVFTAELPSSGIILIGNESRGISPQLETWVTRKVFIPSFGDKNHGKAESLNASIATAILCSEFLRNQF